MRYWKRVTNGQTTTVENYSHDLDIEGAIEITQAEFDAYIVSLPKLEPIPARDLSAEMDDLKARVAKLEVK